jgi:hypothetical protein
MSTTNPAVPAPAMAGPNEIRIVSHSSIFYWWLVWAVGFLLGILTAIDGSRLATVPNETEIGHKATGEVKYKPLAEPNDKNKQDKTITEDLKGRDVLIAPAGTEIKMEQQPHLRISRNKAYGIVFAAVLLLVIVITNVPMRGLWSLIVILFILSLVIILALMGAWHWILFHLSFLDIRMTMGGYFFISGILFGIWLITFLFFDPQIYTVFTPGQFQMHLAIGEGETAYDTSGMTVQKVRSDLFRHWILGLGSGDLVVRTSGAQAHQFELHNVLFVGPKERAINEMMRARAVVAGRMD